MKVLLTIAPFVCVMIMMFCGYSWGDMKKRGKKVLATVQTLNGLCLTSWFVYCIFFYIPKI